MPRKIIFDTDPGQDDATAILLALGSPDEIEVLGVVATAGNAGLERTSRNARKILELAGRSDIPVFAGCPRPIHRELVTAEHVHGATGLDGVDLPEPAMPVQAMHGVDYIIQAIEANVPKTVTLCTLGPLTNVAMALVKAPAIAARIKEIVLMGGAYFEVGNITPSAEFNIYVDPEAANVVFASGVKLTVLPLDVTHRVLSSKQRLDRLRAIGNRCGTAVADLLSFSESFDLKKYGWGAAPLHDPCVVAYLLRPEIFSGRQVNVSIETSSLLTLGMTVVDYWQITDRPRNAYYVRDADADAFYALLTERLARLP